MDYQKLCEEVLNVDPHVRFTGVLDSKGDLVTEKSREDANLLDPNEGKMSIHYTFERWTRLQNLSYKFGKEKLAIIEYENVILISMQLNKNLFLFSTDPDANYTNIIIKIKCIMTKYQE